MRIRWSIVVWWVLALLLASGFARLGFWQWGRAAEKRVQLEQVAQVLHHPQAVGLLAPSAGPYSWAQGRGTFDPQPVILLDNQQRDGKVGVQTYGVFAPAQAPEQRILVDLGWLPMTDRQKWPAVAVPQGEVLVRGLRSAAPSAGIKLADADASMQRKAGQWLVLYMDTQELSAAIGKPLWPQVLRLDPKLPMGSERDLALHINSLPPERHVGYAVQWWGLALTVLLTALILTLKFGVRPRKPVD